MFVWWCLTSLSTIFQLYRGGQFYWWRKPEDPEKRENHWPVTSHWQTLSHNVVHLALIEIRTHNISCDGTGSCKSNHYAIMDTMASDRNMVISFKTFISKNDDSTKVIIFENVIEAGQWKTHSFWNVLLGQRKCKIYVINSLAFWILKILKINHSEPNSVDNSFMSSKGIHALLLCSVTRDIFSIFRIQTVVTL